MDIRYSKTWIIFCCLLEPWTDSLIRSKCSNWDLHSTVNKGCRQWLIPLSHNSWLTQFLIAKRSRHGTNSASLVSDFAFNRIAFFYLRDVYSKGRSFRIAFSCVVIFLCCLGLFVPARNTNDLHYALSPAISTSTRGMSIQWVNRNIATGLLNFLAKYMIC